METNTVTDGKIEVSATGENVEAVQGDHFRFEIEECTQDDVSAFVHDYLSVKTLSTPTISHVYDAYKDYAEKEDITYFHLQLRPVC